MKYFIRFLQIAVALLFIFSGLVKAIDPTGLSYKMQEFFEAWSNNDFTQHRWWEFFFNHSLALSITMITAEIILGVALLLGYAKRLVSFLLLGLIIMFTFLTSYVLFSGKIKACGCFGDCIPITPTQTFTKDIILLIAILLLVIFSKHIYEVFAKKWQFLSLLVILIATLFFQKNVLVKLPPYDCLPFAKGNNIAELSKKPAGADDEYQTAFIYEKDGVTKDFTDSLPDETWTFKEPQKKLIKKGNGLEAKIKDFSLSDTTGNEVTNILFSSETDSIKNSNYLLFFVRDWDKGSTKWSDQFVRIYNKSKGLNKILYVVTAQPTEANEYFNLTNTYNVPILSLDAKALYTAARAPVVLFEMNGGVIIDKWGQGNLNKY